MRFILLLLFVMSLAGCATTQTKSSQDQLQSRVVDLEKKLEEKDAEIVDLQYEVKDLSGKVENAVVASAPVIQDTSETKVVLKSSDDVIRVNTSAQKVQTALKNAGFYPGKIDGKVGGGTKAAIASFQKSVGLKSDGVVGPKTWDALKQHLN